MAPIAMEKQAPLGPMGIKRTKLNPQFDNLVDKKDVKPRPDKKLPVTLLSGFLGAGKTTLLEHILTSSHGYRVGVIVNDMGALNIDAALLANHKVHQEQERVVEMQNGCICCTLRGDLLEEVARLADDGNVDYLLIESSGISEPMQVAETFSNEFAEMHIQAGLDLVEEMHEDAELAKKNSKIAEILKQGGLSRISRLDTCVTMVDAVNVFNDFNTADFLTDRHGKDDVPEEDDRNISDLQTDQIEFANVVIINKCDLVSKEEVHKIKGLVKMLNPDADILTSTKSRVDIGNLLNTHSFDYAKASLGAGWLRSLVEDVKPETEEYGIGSFVFRARRPFHPSRLWKMIKNNFVVIQEESMDDGFEAPEKGGELENDGENDHNKHSHSTERTVEPDENDKVVSGKVDENEDEDANQTIKEKEEEQEQQQQQDQDEDEDEEEDEQPQLNPKARLEAKKANPTFAPLLRSKGFVWLATRPTMFGEWSQAGVMLTLTGGDKWRCEVPEDEWLEDERTKKIIRKDYQGEWDDRRQEIVLIGQQMSKGGKERLQASFEECLLDDEEWAKWEEVMRKKCDDEEKREQLEDLFEDGFEDWDVDDEEHGSHEGHNHPH